MPGLAKMETNSGKIVVYAFGGECRDGKSAERFKREHNAWYSIPGPDYVLVQVLCAVVGTHIYIAARTTTQILRYSLREMGYSAF
jgi:hypothetical protein